MDNDSNGGECMSGELQYKAATGELLFKAATGELLYAPAAPTWAALLPVKVVVNTLGETHTFSAGILGDGPAWHGESVGGVEVYIWPDPHDQSKFEIQINYYGYFTTRQCVYETFPDEEECPDPAFKRWHGSYYELPIGGGWDVDVYFGSDAGFEP